MSTSWEKSDPQVEQDKPSATMGMRPDAKAFAGASGLLEMDNKQVVALWCAHYGLTPDELALAAGMVGHMPAALHYYLSSRGRPTKVVTDEMRAARGPIRTRDRRRKHHAPVSDSANALAAGIQDLDEKSSASERGVRTSSSVEPQDEPVHAEHPCLRHGANSAQ